MITDSEYDDLNICIDVIESKTTGDYTVVLKQYNWNVNSIVKTWKYIYCLLHKAGRIDIRAEHSSIYYTIKLFDRDIFQLFNGKYSHFILLVRMLQIISHLNYPNKFLYDLDRDYDGSIYVVFEDVLKDCILGLRPKGVLTSNTKDGKKQLRVSTLLAIIIYDFGITRYIAEGLNDDDGDYIIKYMEYIRTNRVGFNSNYNTIKFFQISE